MRAAWVAIVCVLLTGGCSRAQTTTEAREHLSDADPRAREAAAVTLRKMPVTDVGEAVWKARLAAIAPGLTLEQLLIVTRASEEARPSTPATPYSHPCDLEYPDGRGLRLDDYWTVAGFFVSADPMVTPTTPQLLHHFGPLVRSPRAVWVTYPPGFSGKWLTYYVTGAVALEIELVDGRQRKLSAYYDNGQLVCAERYEASHGMLEGAEVGYYRDGKKAYEGHHVKGQREGEWFFWDPTGKPKPSATYLNDRLQ